MMFNCLEFQRRDKWMYILKMKSCRRDFEVVCEGSCATPSSIRCVVGQLQFKVFCSASNVDTTIYRRLSCSSRVTRMNVFVIQNNAIRILFKQSHIPLCIPSCYNVWLSGIVLCMLSFYAPIVITTSYGSNI